MYAVVRRYEGVTSPAAAGRLVDQEFLDLIAKIPGFIAYYWVDAGNRVMCSTSLFDDKAGADASVRLAADFVRERGPTLLPSPPQVTAGEVVAHRTSIDLPTEQPASET
jgi:hypothetical protein